MGRGKAKPKAEPQSTQRGDVRQLFARQAAANAAEKYAQPTKRARRVDSALPSASAAAAAGQTRRADMLMDAVGLDAATVPQTEKTAAEPGAEVQTAVGEVNMKEDMCPLLEPGTPTALQSASAAAAYGQTLRADMPTHSALPSASAAAASGHQLDAAASPQKEKTHMEPRLLTHAAEPSPLMVPQTENVEMEPGQPVHAAEPSAESEVPGEVMAGKALADQQKKAVGGVALGRLSQQLEDATVNQKPRAGQLEQPAEDTALKPAWVLKPGGDAASGQPRASQLEQPAKDTTLKPARVLKAHDSTVSVTGSCFDEMSDSPLTNPASDHEHDGTGPPGPAIGDNMTALGEPSPTLAKLEAPGN